MGLNLKPFVVMSAEVAGRGVVENYHAQNELVDLLTRLNFSFGEARGVYKGVEEMTVVVTLDVPDVTQQLNQLRGIAASFDQECILYVMSCRSAELVYPDGSHESLVGVWKEISKARASSFDGYTIRNGHYYAVTV